jgi:hypothetical protein
MSWFLVTINAVWSFFSLIVLLGLFLGLAWVVYKVAMWGARES